MDEVSNYYRVIQRAFEKLAPWYDAICLPISGIRDQVAHLIASERKMRILDVATGTGSQALAFAKRGHEVVGVDLSPAMIEVARKKNTDGRVRFEIADATCLPFADDLFDAACISFALHDMPLTIREKVLCETVRVTRPAGIIVVVDYGLPRNRFGKFLIYRLVNLYEGEYYTPFIKSHLPGLLRQCGIEIVQEHPVLLGAARIIEGHKLSRITPEEI